MRKVVFAGTHPYQLNGYSRINYHLSKELSKYPDIKLYIFGFQNFYKNREHELERKLPDNVEIYDAHENENPKNKGFGENLIVDYLNKVDPDIVIIYNDLVIINTMLEKIKTMQNRRFKIVPYIDIVYKNEKNSLIKNIEMNVDAGIMFTKYWEDVIKYQGFSKPLYILEHAFDSKLFFPIPKKLSRKYFGLSEDEFIIVNLNRNQPRKRWDICMMSYVKFISKHLGENVKLMIATNIQGGWDLLDMILSECRKYKIDVEEFKKHLIVIQNPQQITDYDINVMYNVGDIGINTCDGEGFGLCNFEQGGVGVPQIIPNVGGFKDFFNKTNSIIVDPKWSYYCDHSRDFVAGEAEICDINDIVDALEMYYNNRDLIKEHGKKARETVLKYKWEDKGKQLYDIIMECTKDIPENKIENNVMENIDINKLIESHKAINHDDDDELEVITGSDEKNIEKNTEETIEEIDINKLIDEKIKGNVIKEDEKKIEDIDNMNEEEMKALLKKLINK